MNQSIDPENAGKYETEAKSQNKNSNRTRVVDILLIVGALLAGAFGSDQSHVLMLSFVFLTICLALFGQ